MAEHADLVREMVELEKMPSTERLKLARGRRQKQIKKYLEHEKKLDKQEKQAQKRKSKASSAVIQPAALSVHKPKSHSFAADSTGDSKQNGFSRKVQFDKGVMLLEAATRNDINEVKGLLKEGVSPDVANEDGLTALHQCCIDDSEAMLLLLLEYGADVNARDSELWTPLHAAATCAHLQICQHLLNRSADLLAVNADGNMPYDICDDETTLEFIETSMSNQGITQECIDETRLSTEISMLDDIKEYEREGYKVSDWKDRTGTSLLHIAAANGYYDVTSYLLTKRVDVNLYDDDGWTPAMAAACWGQIPVLELLAKNGADLDVKTKDHKSLVDLVDDLEVKDQITEIKQEMKLNVERFKREHMDVRRRSSTNIRSMGGGSILGASSLYNSNTSLSDRNPFSSSVRRHSMREKHKLSMQEARDEAKFRISISTDDSDPSSPTTTGPDDSKTSQAPVTNIDDVKIDVKESNVTTITVNSGEGDAPTPETQDQHKPEDTSEVPQTKLVATIKIEDGNSKQNTDNTAQMNGDRNSGEAKVKTNSLKANDAANRSSTASPKPAERGKKFQQSDIPSSQTNPVEQHHDPPVRRYTSYNPPSAGYVTERPKKGCCSIL